MNNKNKLIKKVLVSVIPFFVFLLPFFVFAAGEATGISNPIKYFNITDLVKEILGYIVKIGGVVATLAFIWAGFIYVKAQGKPAELDKAKTIFINTCIGAAILLGAQLISTIISGTINSLK